MEEMAGRTIPDARIRDRRVVQGRDRRVDQGRDRRVDQDRDRRVDQDRGQGLAGLGSTGCYTDVFVKCSFHGVHREHPRSSICRLRGHRARKSVADLTRSLWRR